MGWVLLAALIAAAITMLFVYAADTDGHGEDDDD